MPSPIMIPEVCGQKIVISVTKRQLEFLERLLSTGLHGFTMDEMINRIISKFLLEDRLWP